MPLDNSDLIEKFICYLEGELNYSRHTLKAYRCDLEEFRQWATDGKIESFDAVDTDSSDIRAWLAWMSEKGISVRTLRRKTQSLRAFYHYLMRQGLTKVNPAKDIILAKLPKPLPTFIKPEETEAVLEAEYDPNDFEAVRDHLIVDMLYSTGIRAAEIIGLKDSDVDLKKGELKVLGKRNKERIIPFGEELKELILHYRQLRSRILPSEKVEEFFIRKTGEPLYYMLLNRVVHRQLDGATQASKRSPHVLRHSFATDMLNGGASLSAVQQLLGHESLATTQVYTHITYRDLQQNYQQAHPRAQKKKKTMELRIQAIKFDMAERLESFINKKAERLARHYVDITEIDVNLKVVKPETAMNKEAVVKVVLPPNDDFVASKVADSFEEAVDLCIEAIEKQLEKKKEKK